MVTRKSSLSSLVLVAMIGSLALVPSGCGVRRKPNLMVIFKESHLRTGKRPIIVIPGLLGTELVNQRTGEVVWPALRRSSGDELDLPVSPDLGANRDGLRSGNIIDKARFVRILPKVSFFHELLELLRVHGGYKEGDWNNPAEDGDRDTFYVFAYDWRRDTVETARDFINRVKSLKNKLGRPDLRFNLISQSNGGLIARYAAMYGDADLTPEGSRPVPTWTGAEHIDKIIMFGTPNKGSAEAFAALLRGYSITSGKSRRMRLLHKLSREDALTAPSMFALLPHIGFARFLDGDLKELRIDLYDPAVWRRYGWSAANDPDYRKRFIAGKTGSDDLGAKRDSADDLDAYLAVVLSRAKRFHESLDVAMEEAPPISFFAFGGDCEQTLNALVIHRDEGSNKWVTMVEPRELRTSSGRVLSRDEVAAEMFVPGDGRVTRCSLLAQRSANAGGNDSLYNSALPLAYAVFGCDIHSKLQGNPTLLDNALTLLVGQGTISMRSDGKRLPSR